MQPGQPFSALVLLIQQTIILVKLAYKTEMSILEELDRTIEGGRSDRQKTFRHKSATLAEE